MLRILSGGKCAVSEQEICLQVEKHKKNLRVECADLAVCLMAVKLQMFADKTRHVWHPIRTCFFCLVSTLRCNQRYIIQAFVIDTVPHKNVSVSSFSKVNQV